MKKKILSFLLTLCMVIGLIPCTALASDSFTVTVCAGTGGKVSTDGNTWSDRATVTVPAGEKIGDKIAYRADEGYALDSIVSRVDITAIAAGRSHTVILDDQGQVYTDGDNGSGQRAVGKAITLAPIGAPGVPAWQFLNPTNGLDGVKVKAISAGGSFTVALSEDGDVYTTGTNRTGQLGRDYSDALKAAFPGTSLSRENSFVKVTVGDGTVKIKAIAASADFSTGDYAGHTVLVDENGKVWTAGTNYYNQLGRTTTNKNNNPEFKQVEGEVNNATIVAAAAGNWHTLLLDSEGQVWISGTSFIGPNAAKFTKCSIEGNPKITAMAAGLYLSALLDEDGNVYTVGRNNYGQLGLNDNTDRNVFTKVPLADGIKIKSIEVGREYTILVDENGKVYVAGRNNNGQLGLPLETATVNVFTPVTIAGLGEHKIVSAAAFEYHTILLDDTGRIWSAGKSNNWQLGRKMTYNQISPSFELAMASPILQEVSITDLSDFTVTGNHTITVNFKEREKINVSYDLNGGDWISGFTPPTFYYKEDSFAAPDGANLVKNGYRADSWDFSKLADDTLLCTIRWEVKSGYTVTFDTNGGSAVDGKTNVKWTDKVLDGVSAPARDGYVFAGWKCGDTDVAADTTYADLAVNDTVESVTLTAQWTEKSNFTVTFDTNGGSDIADKTNVKWTDKVLDSVSAPARNGYLFAGWRCGDTDVAADMTYADLAVNDTVTTVTLTAQWTEKSNFTVVFDTNGGSAVDSKTNVKWTDKVLDGVFAPARDGYAFTGWKYGDIDVTADTTYADLAVNDTVTTVTLTAQWHDVTAPTGEIKIVENTWKTFLNNITFGLFFKETQTVTITAADNSGETVKIEYLLSDKELTEAELAGMTFTEYSAPFAINPNHEYVVYVKLTDTSSNAAYINTNGIVLDKTAPVISGIENGKTYCTAQTVTVGEKYIDTVTVNGKAVTLDSNHSFALNPADGTQTIIVTDKAGNETTMSVTVNDGHTYEWQSENGQYWQKCKFCGDETAKKDIPAITINGADKVCRTQNYKFGFTLTESATDATYGYEFIGLGDGPITPTLENGLYCGVIKSTVYPAKENSFELVVNAQTADGFAFFVRKTVAIQDEHTGGTATCTEKAKCEVCGESYGELNANNHTDLKHIKAKAATKTDEGNIEYWYCSGCDKYYKDAAAMQEIIKADTVIAKLPDDSKSPQTGDNSNLTLWIALLFISGGAVAGTRVVSRKRKRCR